MTAGEVGVWILCFLGVFHCFFFFFPVNVVCEAVLKFGTLLYLFNFIPLTRIGRWSPLPEAPGWKGARGLGIGENSYLFWSLVGLASTAMTFATADKVEISFKLIVSWLIAVTYWWQALCFVDCFEYYHLHKVLAVLSTFSRLLLALPPVSKLRRTRPLWLLRRWTCLFARWITLVKVKGTFINVNSIWKIS